MDFTILRTIEAMKKLQAIIDNKEQYESEGAHLEAEEILLDSIYPLLAQKYREVKKELGFWYS